ncbi:hypothetical protein COLO4_00083 [Corchorus olitorius]|uniref:Uncharacterized protein n=1 Tax=Corchorus olitorius TaxID=93759 RepID=A0A1R3L4R3_9ROSI|nr:hypothetical protein COLO4_02739 [Corchorus olitorius]OMP14296.1 hypothetical protein COLO4_00083 [Corchorus olitorius]
MAAVSAVTQITWASMVRRSALFRADFSLGLRRASCKVHRAVARA